MTLIPEIDMDQKVKFMRGFSDKTRLQILDCLQKEEKTVSEIVEILQGNQSNISQHLACLKGCGLIKSRQQGKYVYYALRNDQVGEILDSFDLLFRQLHQEMHQCEHHIIGGGEDE
ncbi:ArsR/SmtB family transcription factor [Marinicrinis sediminis]|uniref:ArsR/SmtB family transcription factor n=1 Tax=Marinicrinis sediminis TaxID=1652465 RepID=A0ABW5R9S0_9BACL